MLFYCVHGIDEGRNVNDIETAAVGIYGRRGVVAAAGGLIQTS